MANTMTQVKFTIEADIVAAFKARCESEGVSMASVIRRWMAAGQPARAPTAKADTRPHRRKTVAELTGVLETVLQKEDEYRAAIPEAFQSRLEAADWACGQLETAIDCLQNAF